jgi:integrase
MTVETTTYKSCRYFVPSSLLASQTAEKLTRARKRAIKVQLLTYKDLFEKQAHFVTTKQVNTQTAANRATALRNFLRINEVSEDDVVGTEMRSGFSEALEKFVQNLQASSASSRSISNTRAALSPWRHWVMEDDNMRALDAEKPSPFRCQLKLLLAGHSVKHVSKQSEIPHAMLLGWVKGKVPRQKNTPLICRLESFFGTERGFLTSLAGHTQTPRYRTTTGEAGTNEYRATLGARTKDEYWFRPEITSPLRAQWENFTRYKTDEVPLLERSPGGAWRISPLPLTPDTPANWYVFIDSQEVASAKAAWAKVGGFLGWLGLSAERGGLDIPAHQLNTMAWFAVPSLFQRYLKWRKLRAGDKYNSSAPESLGWVSSLMRVEVGYFPQNPWLRETLPVEYRVGDWASMCSSQMAFCRRMTLSLRGKIEVSRDPFLAIKHIVDLPEPMEALVDMIHRLRADRPIGNVEREAVWSRDMVTLKLLASNPLRLRQFSHMTWKPDNTGNLYQKVDGSWWILWKMRYFKNALGAAGDADYDCPVQESVWQDIERYLFKHRQVLLRVATDLVFLTKKGGPVREGQAHLPWKDLSRRVSELTRRHLWKSDGIGCHSFRHIVGTSIVKAGNGDFATAAAVLNDRAETVRKHYGRFNGKDGSARMNELLGKSFKRM